MRVTDQVLQPYQIIRSDLIARVCSAQRPAERDQLSLEIGPSRGLDWRPVRADRQIDEVPIPMLQPIGVADIARGVGAVRNIAVVLIAGVGLDGVGPGRGPDECDLVALTDGGVGNPTRIVGVEPQQ